MVQVLLALEYMHAKGVMHRDIKPSNLLWFVDGDSSAVKICDLGLSKVYCKQTPQSPRVITSWYRAPEVCGDDPNYTSKIDIWSAGCIFYEMLHKVPYLNNCPDDNTVLLSKIIGLASNPTQEEITKLTQNHKIKLTRDASPRHRKTLKELLGYNADKIKTFNEFPCGNAGATYEQFLDLLENMMALDPSKRFSATQALQHKFFEPYYEIIIQWCRNLYKPIPPKLDSLNIHVCKERVWASRNSLCYLQWSALFIMV